MVRGRPHDIPAENVMSPCPDYERGAAEAFITAAEAPGTNCPEVTEEPGGKTDNA